MKLTSATAITVRTLANQAAVSIRFARLYVSSERKAACVASASAYIDAAKTVARHAQTFAPFAGR